MAFHPMEDLVEEFQHPVGELVPKGLSLTWGVNGAVFAALQDLVQFGARLAGSGLGIAGQILGVLQHRGKAAAQILRGWRG